MANRRQTTPSSGIHVHKSENQETSKILFSRLRLHVKESEKLKEERAKDERAAETAGRYLKLAALAWAREYLQPLFQNDDDRITRVETMLRAARHVRRTSDHNGDPIPSVRRADGTLIPLTARLIELMGRDRVLQANNADDFRSPSKTSKASQAGREARDEIKAKAAQVIREGEVVA
jgi:hypothetical protein